MQLIYLYIIIYSISVVLRICGLYRHKQIYARAHLLLGKYTH